MLAEVAAMVEPTEQTIYDSWNLITWSTLVRRPAHQQSDSGGCLTHTPAHRKLGRTRPRRAKANELLKEGSYPQRASFEAISVISRKGHAVERSCRIVARSPTPLLRVALHAPV